LAAIKIHHLGKEGEYKRQFGDLKEKEGSASEQAVEVVNEYRSRRPPWSMPPGAVSRLPLTMIF
jgi:hypothetical protein